MSRELYLAPDTDAKDLYDHIITPGGVNGDAGVDLRFPSDIVVPSITETNGMAVVVGLRVRGRIVQGRDVDAMQYGAYLIMPRSSIAKTPLSLANSVGLVDAGYTGELKVGLRNHSSKSYEIKRGTSLFQVVSPDLSPMSVTIVTTDSPHFTSTARGAGGFGSTGNEGSKK